MPRRSSIVLLSVTGHAIALGVLALVSILAPEALPFPRALLAAPVMRVVHTPDPPPAPSRTTTRSDTRSVGARAPAPDPAPVVQPDDIAPDTNSSTGDVALRERVNGLENAAGIVAGSGLGGSESVALPPQVVRPPVRLHSGMEAPRRVRDRAPEYPALARAASVQGIVILEVIISERGDVTEARVLRSVAVLDQAALDAVRRWKFSPARLNGEAIPVVMTVTVNFTLR